MIPRQKNVLRLPVAHALIVLSVGLLASCDGTPSDPDPPTSEESLTVTGATVNRTGGPLPNDVRVLLMWVVTSTSPDEVHLLGEGSLEGDGATFRLDLEAAPPTEALNFGALGVGVIFATTNQEIETGGTYTDLPIPEEEIVGVAGQHAVIYVGEDLPTEAASDWPGSFPEGYSVGVGVEREGEFDAFEPTDPSSVELVFDDLESIDIVNWS